MSQSILTASTPIYALSDHTLISLKTYNWLLNIGVTTIEEMAMAFQVASIPTVIAFRDGKAVNQSVGVVPKETLLALLQ